MESTPKHRPRRRWLQFSLKTFLVLLTVFGIWLGVVVNRANRQRRAVEALREMGWQVEYEDINDGWFVSSDDGTRYVDHPELLPWRHRVFGRDLFSNVVEVRPYVEAYYMKRSNALLDQLRRRNLRRALDQIAQLTHVMELRLDELEITDEGLTCLRELTRLEELGVRQTQITDDGLREIARLKRLRSLDLSQTSITDVGVDHLQGLEKLSELDLEGTRVTKSSVLRLDAGLQYGVNAPQFGFVPP